MLYHLILRFEDTLTGWGLYFPAQLEFRALTAAVFAFLVVLVAGKPVIAWLRSKKIGDSGFTDAEALRQMSASKANTPTMGGVLIVGAIALATLLLADLSNFYIILGIVVIAWLSVLGGIDDSLKLREASGGSGSRQGVRPWEKLVGQIGLGVIVGFFLYRHADAQGIDLDLGHVVNLPFQRTYVYVEGLEGGFRTNPGLIYLGPIAFIVITALLVTGMSNATNITDGMDGLATGICAAICIGLAVLVTIAGDIAEAQHFRLPHIPESDELVVLTAAAIGACLGFLWWNCAPAQVFMGDTGSLALGGLLAYVGVVIRQEILLLIMATLLLIEIGSVVGQVGFFKWTRLRTGTGRRLFKVAPIHHHFHVSGWTENQVVVRFWIMTMICVVLALVLIKPR